MINLSDAIEIALFLLVAYLLGCALGYGAHRLVRAMTARPAEVSKLSPETAPRAVVSKRPQHVPAPVLVRSPPSAARRLAAASREAPEPVPAASRVRRPPELPAPRGKPDDLKQIKGIGKKTESALNDLGIYHFSQIAAWQPGHIEWLEGRIAIKGRIRREQWIEQATLLATMTTAA